MSGQHWTPSPAPGTPDPLTGTYPFLTACVTADTVNVAQCLSIVGSERTLDLEVRTMIHPLTTGDLYPSFWILHIPSHCFEGSNTQ